MRFARSRSPRRSPPIRPVRWGYSGWGRPTVHPVALEFPSVLVNVSLLVVLATPLAVHSPAVRCARLRLGLGGDPWGHALDSCDVVPVVANRRREPRRPTSSGHRTHEPVQRRETLEVADRFDRSGERGPADQGRDGRAGDPSAECDCDTVSGDETYPSSRPARWVAWRSTAAVAGDRGRAEHVKRYTDGTYATIALVKGILCKCYVEPVRNLSRQTPHSRRTRADVNSCESRASRPKCSVGQCLYFWVVQRSRHMSRVVTTCERGVFENSINSAVHKGGYVCA